MRILSVAGAPTGILHLAPVARALAARADVTHMIVHAGARGDAAAALLGELGVPAPDRHLDVKPATPGVEMGLIMQRFEPVATELEPDVLLVYGDDNAAVAGALVGAQLGIQVGHIGAGLRTGDLGTPEEINRIVADGVATLLFAPSREAMEHLGAQPGAAERAHFVGNPSVEAGAAMPELPPRQGLVAGEYAVTALGAETVARLEGALNEVARRLPVVELDGAGFLESLGTVARAALVVTDSAAWQDQTTYLGVPCLTIGTATECSATCQHGTNRLVAPDRGVFLAAVTRALTRRGGVARPVVERWDGHAAERIAAVIVDGAQFPLDAGPAAGLEPAARPHRNAVAMREPALTG